MSVLILKSVVYFLKVFVKLLLLRPFKNMPDTCVVAGCSNTHDSENFKETALL